MKPIKDLFIVFVVILLIPIGSFGTYFFILKDLNTKIQKQGDLEVLSFCQSLQIEEFNEEDRPYFLAFCQKIHHLHLLGKISIFTALFGIGIPLFYLGFAWFAGKTRKRMVLFFPQILQFSTLLVAILFFLQTFIFLYSLYRISDYFFSSIPWSNTIVMIGILGIGISALVGGIRLLISLVNFRQSSQVSVLGKSVTPEEAPELFAFIQSLAKKLEAKCPDHILIGFMPTFFVTSCEVYIPNEERCLKGESLYLSAPLCRILSKEELTSIIGHELGHFRGEDTAYSMKFAPLYTGLGQALKATDSDKEDPGIFVKRPSLLLICYLYQLFALYETKISRDREYKADQVGAEAGSAFAFSTALIKVSLYDSLWEAIFEHTLLRLNDGKVSYNISLVFQDVAKYDVEKKDMEEILGLTLEQVITHPTDTHPPISKRLIALGIPVDRITKDLLFPPEESAIDLIDNYQEIEQDITQLYNHRAVTQGLVSYKEKTDTNPILHACYALAAAMTCADGKIDLNEIFVAEGIGKKFFEEFDSIEFREYCHHPEFIGDLKELSQALGEALKESEKHIILEYLYEISKADGEISKEEETLLADIAAGFNFSEEADS